MLGRIVKAVLIGLGIYAGAQLVLRLLRRLYPFPVPPLLAPLLQNPFWNVGQTRQLLVQDLGLCAGMKVLEVGAGPGHITAEVARALGPEGQLTAIDAQPQMVARLAAKLRRQSVESVHVQAADPRDLPFANETFDMAYLVTVLGAIADRGRALRELRRVLKPNGRLAIIESVADPDYMVMIEVVGWAQAVGFELVEQKGSGLLYTLVFRSMFGS